MQETLSGWLLGGRATDQSDGTGGWIKFTEGRRSWRNFLLQGLHRRHRQPRGHDRPAGPRLVLQRLPDHGRGHRRRVPRPAVRHPQTTRPAPLRGRLVPVQDRPAEGLRVIECEIIIATTAGRTTGVYRLATTLLDARRYPAFELVKQYHERWEAESAFFAIKKSMLGRRVLRARSMPGMAQEIYALLTAYQLIRIAIADTTAALPDADPDRACFSIALQTARDQVIQAAGVIADTTVDLVGTSDEPF
ncbi:transposase [Streptomyces sp. NPDC006668]|uniref:transposase n=1 Tax=Streptomyces sp. NPDC006668 TaxID=3156903 RepID=UPI0033DB2E23